MQYMKAAHRGLQGFGMVATVLEAFKKSQQLENQTIHKLNSFGPFKIRACSVFEPPMYIVVHWNIESLS